jgi:hypothetical protein
VWFCLVKRIQKKIHKIHVDNKSLESVENCKYFEKPYEIKISFVKKLRAD